MLLFILIMLPIFGVLSLFIINREKNVELDEQQDKTLQYLKDIWIIFLLICLIYYMYITNTEQSENILYISLKRILSYLVGKLWEIKLIFLFMEGGESSNTKGESSNTKGSSSKEGESSNTKGSSSKKDEEMRSPSEESEGERQNRDGEFVKAFKNPCPCCDRNECDCEARDGNHNMIKSEGQGALIPGDTERVCCSCGSSHTSVCCFSCQCIFCSMACAYNHDPQSPPGETYSSDDSYLPEDSKKESSGKGKERED